MTVEPFEPVELESPDGRPYTAQTARELNQLKYGAGYRERQAKQASPAPRPEPARAETEQPAAKPTQQAPSK